MRVNAGLERKLQHIRKYAQPIPIPPNNNYERISLGSLLVKGFFFRGVLQFGVLKQSILEG